MIASILAGVVVWLLLALPFYALLYAHGERERQAELAHAEERSAFTG